MPTSANADPLSVPNPRRDVDLQSAALDDPALAPAVGARRLERLAGALAVRARALLDELAEQVLRDATDDAAAAARRARPRARAGLRPGRPATSARRGHVRRDRDGEAP